MRSLDLLFPLLAFIARCQALTSERLECLQNEQGTELTNTTWRFDYLSTASFQAKDTKQWAYVNDHCPLNMFDVRNFCQNVLGCGRKLLMVGDSTMYTLLLTLPHLVPGKTSNKECPTVNGCTHENHHCERKAKFKVFSHNICTKECRRSPTFITYVRHDFLMQAHGEKYLHSSVCEHWMQISRQYDYVLVTKGPHVSRMVSQPYSRGEPAANVSALFVETSTYIASRIRALLKPGAKLIFRTGGLGVTTWTEDVSTPPNTTAPVVEGPAAYYWTLIPLLNEIYTASFRRYLPADQFLLMNTTRLMSKISGGRSDYIHFNHRYNQTPALIEWQILYNILEEVQAIEKTQHSKKIVLPHSTGKKPSHLRLSEQHQARLGPHRS